MIDHKGQLPHVENIPMPEKVQEALVEAIVTEPDDLIGQITDQMTDAVVHALGITFDLNVHSCADLPIKAPDANFYARFSLSLPGARWRHRPTTQS